MTRYEMALGRYGFENAFAHVQAAAARRRAADAEYATADAVGANATLSGTVDGLVSVVKGLKSVQHDRDAEILMLQCDLDDANSEIARLRAALATATAAIKAMTKAH